MRIHGPSDPSESKITSPCVVRVLAWPPLGRNVGWGRWLKAFQPARVCQNRPDCVRSEVEGPAAVRVMDSEGAALPPTGLAAPDKAAGLQLASVVGADFLENGDRSQRVMDWRHDSGRRVTRLRKCACAYLCMHIRTHTHPGLALQTPTTALIGSAMLSLSSFCGWKPRDPGSEGPNPWPFLRSAVSVWRAFPNVPANHLLLTFPAVCGVLSLWGPVGSHKASTVRLAACQSPPLPRWPGDARRVPCDLPIRTLARVLALRFTTKQGLSRLIG